MNKKELSISVFVLLVISAVVVFAPAPNNATTLAVFEGGEVSLKEYSKLEIKTDSGSYSLMPYRITSDRKVVNLVLKSDHATTGTYFQQYFKLDMGGKTISMFGKSGEVYVYPEKSKTIIIGEEKLYVELESIKNRAVNLIIKVE